MYVYCIYLLYNQHAYVEISNTLTYYPAGSVLLLESLATLPKSAIPFHKPQCPKGIDLINHR